MHGKPLKTVLTGDPASGEPRAARIASLSAEYLEADKPRREAIADEIAGLIAGFVTPFYRG